MRSLLSWYELNDLMISSAGDGRQWVLRAAGRMGWGGRKIPPKNDTQLVRLSPLADRLRANKRDTAEAAITCFRNNYFVKLNLIRYKDFI